ncbi:MAG TPA: phytanoyl-CoA dioxygenase family protein [Novosphingobium sp.]|nr:phytanoyl-CoA dioxygenase family protein [Novosphingobium sp.]
MPNEYEPIVVQAPYRDLTKEEVGDFAQDGVICLRGLYCPEWVDALTTELDTIRERGVLGTGIKVDGSYYEWMQNDIIRDFVLFGPTAKLVAQALKTERLNFFYDQIFIKEKLGGKGTPWHHDHTFWPLDGKQIASVWTAMEPVTASGSALEFVAGSHLWGKKFEAVGVGGPVPSKDNVEPLPDIDAHREQYRILSWELEPGDALLFNAMILHGSRPNSAPQNRRAITTRWTGDDVRYKPIEGVVRELWNHSVKEGDSLSGSLYPQILPGLLDTEVGERLRRPIPPAPERFEAFVASLKSRIAAATQ